MQLGTYVFEWEPDEFTIPKPDKSVSYVRTYTSAAVFSWGTRIIGKEIVLKWNWCSADQFDQLQALLEQDTELTWQVQHEAVVLDFTVELLSLNGNLFQVVGYDRPYRRKIELKMLIMDTTVGS